jgi:putative sporulation protein YyaC
MFKKEIRTNVPFKIDHTHPQAFDHLSQQLHDLINERSQESPIVIVCIGTDRSTGDALGPLVGSRLSSLSLENICNIYGTLEHPVHAVNLKDTLQEIERTFANPFIIAVDACLGQLSSVGQVTVGRGPLKPGAGVNKDLPEVGHIHITGIVNVGGFMEYFVLQNTRLSVVMRMAECIAQSLAATLNKISEPSRHRGHSSLSTFQPIKDSHSFFFQLKKR